MTIKNKTGLGALISINKPSIKGIEAANQATPEKVPPVHVVIRFNPADHETVSHDARQQGMSIQEYVEHCINANRASRGLAEIEGRPRSKTRRKHY